MECLSAHSCMVTVLHIMVGLERMLDYRGVGARFHCIDKDGPYLIITLIPLHNVAMSATRTLILYVA